MAVPEWGVGSVTNEWRTCTRNLSLLLACLLLSPVLEARATDAVPLEPGKRELFLDDHVLDQTENLSRSFHRPRKRGVVLKADIPSDGTYVETVSAPMWIPDDGIYKFVYEARHRATGGKGTTYWALALSRDGLNWEKPNLGALEFNGNRENNLIDSPERQRLWQVVHDPDDPDPERRYKGFLGASGRRPVVSPDCIHWQLLEVEKLPSGDAGTLTYDRASRQFLGLLKFTGKYGRSYNLSVSKDFVNWSEPRFLFSTDDEDQRMALDVIRRRLADPGLAKPLMVDPDPATGWKQPPEKFRNRGTWNVQCYNIGVFPYEGVHLGWLMFFYPTGIRLPEKTNTDGFNEMQLAMTRDLKTWKRLGDRQPFISTSRLDEGLVGNYDRLQLNVTNQPVDRGDELWFYYTGMKRRVPQHDRYRNGAPRDPSTLSAEERADWIEDTHSAVYVSVLRRDGFISLDADENGGFLLTKPLKMAGDRLFLNLQAPEGEARVEILDETGVVVPGFGLDDSAAAGGDQVRVPVGWKGRNGLSDLAGRTVRLKIHLRDASLYSFWTE